MTTERKHSRCFIGYALPLYGRWVYDKSREIPNARGVSHICIRKIREITSLRSVGLRRVSCSKKLGEGTATEGKNRWKSVGAVGEKNHAPTALEKASGIRRPQISQIDTDAMRRDFIKEHESHESTE